MKLVSKIKQGCWRASVPLRTAFAKRGGFFSENDRRLWALKDKHVGRDAVVIGMGPSLRPEDLERFSGMVSFACNKIYLAYEQTSWRPDYYSVVDVLVAENNRQEIANLKGSTKIFPMRLRARLPDMPEALFFHNASSMKSRLNDPCFPNNPLEGVVSGGATVLIPLVQMAFWMGCQRIYIVGLDFSFEVPENTEEEAGTGRTILRCEGEVNHFHKDYRKPGERWTVPRMEQQELAFAFAREALEADGREIINASRVSKLNVLPRRDFESIFGGKVAH